MLVPIHNVEASAREAGAATEIAAIRKMAKYTDKCKKNLAV